MPTLFYLISCYVRSILKHPNVHIMNIQVGHKDDSYLLFILQVGNLVATFHSKGTFTLLLLLLHYGPVFRSLQVNEVYFFKFTRFFVVFKYNKCLSLPAASYYILVLSAQLVTFHFFHRSN
jgi:hypothetical protein